MPYSDIAPCGRMAQPIYQLVDGDMAHIHLDFLSLEEWLDAEGSITRMACRGEVVVGAISVSPPYHGVAWVRLLAVDACEQHPMQVIEALWDGMPEMLKKAGVRRLGALLYDPWPGQYLLRLGFRLHEWTVMLLRSDGPPPKPIYDDVLIRRIRPSDLDAVVRVDSAAFLPMWQRPPIDLYAALSEETLSTLAEMDGELVAYQITTVNEDSAHLDRLATHPKWQGRGIAGALLSHTINHLLELGIRDMTVSTWKSNVISQRLYTRYNFRPTGETFPIFLWESKG